jgi:hypothetical protein
LERINLLSDDGTGRRAANDRRLIDGLGTTLGSIFQSIYVMDIPETFNSMIYATSQPTTLESLEQNLNALIFRQDVDVLLTDSIRIMLDNVQQAPQSTIVFTDDLSPIEWITNTMIVNYLLEGGIELLQ